MEANTVIILAGGKSTRMGMDKLRIKINGNYLIDNIINKLKNEFDEIIIVTNDPLYHREDGIIVIDDEDKSCGPLCGIYSGLKRSSSNYSFVMACDMPYVNLDFIRYEKEKLNNTFDVIIAKIGVFTEPLYGFYKKEMLTKIYNEIKNGQYSINKLLKKINTKYIDQSITQSFSKDLLMFKNLNTLSDVEEFLKSGE
ncbi:MAG: molybdenum cofactor guanylyltransferase [Spirochaetaceae bacterium]